MILCVYIIYIYNILLLLSYIIFHYDFQPLFNDHPSNHPTPQLSSSAQHQPTLYHYQYPLYQPISPSSVSTPFLSYSDTTVHQLILKSLLVYLHFIAILKLSNLFLSTMDTYNYVSSILLGFQLLLSQVLVYSSIINVQILLKDLFRQIFYS